MTRSFAAKALLGALAVFASIDTAEAGRRRRNRDCCPTTCCPTPCCNTGHSGYAYGGSYSGASNACCSQSSHSQSYAHSMPMYGTPMYGTPMAGAPMPMVNAPAPGIVGSSYADPNQAHAAGAVRVRVKVPTAETRIWVGNQQYQETGVERTINVPLSGAQNQKMTVTAQWIKDGATIVRKKEIELRPGQELAVTFSESDSDS